MLRAVALCPLLTSCSVSARLVQRLLAPAVLLALAACVNPRTATDDSGARVSVAAAADSVALPMGRTVRVDGLVALTLRDVPSDSRCPIDVQCVRAGDATIDLDVCPSGCTSPTPARLGVGVEPRRATISGVRVETMNLRPAPRAGVLTKREDYVAIVRVTRAVR
jgi:hypothetical protein